MMHIHEKYKHGAYTGQPIVVLEGGEIAHARQHACHICLGIPGTGRSRCVESLCLALWIGAMRVPAWMPDNMYNHCWRPGIPPMRQFIRDLCGIDWLAPVVAYYDECAADYRRCLLVLMAWTCPPLCALPHELRDLCMAPLLVPYYPHETIEAMKNLCVSVHPYHATNGWDHAFDVFRFTCQHPRHTDCSLRAVELEIVADCAQEHQDRSDDDA